MEICRRIMGYLGFSLSWAFLLTLLMLVSDNGINAQCSGITTCQNGGVCSDTPDGPACQCVEGTSGELCQLIGQDDCNTPTTHACQNNAQCVDGSGNYTCVCLSGWEGQFCEKERDECQSQPCRNGGNCLDQFDGFTCECPSSFIGPTCDTDVDECLEPGTAPCLNDAACRNEIGGFSCDCRPGYTGSRCETEIDECESSPCHFGGACVDLINNFRCECLEGFTGPECRGIVQECQLSEVCGTTGICVGKPLGGYQCFCKPGYYGVHCETQVNLCASSPCRNRATCINHGTSYTCTCATGYSGVNCESDVNECESEPCLNHGNCSQPAPGQFACQCAPGFTGQTCEVDVDECSGSPCPEYQLCQDLVNGFSCECPLGKTGDLCDTEIFDCRVSPCENGGECVEESKGYKCKCPQPFTDESCGTSTDPCIPNPCIHGGRCNNRINSTGFWCECLDGYVGERCEGDVYDCLSSPCWNNGTCRDLPYKEGDAEEEGVERVKFECDCVDGFTGRLCDEVMEACWDNLCQNGANCTLDGEDDYKCECSPEWTGTHCETNVNECLATPPECLHNGQCIDLTPGFRCVCPAPWTGSVCQERIVYCSNDTCKNGGRCVEGVDGGDVLYTCQCPDAYTGPDCSRPHSPCLPNPCLHSSTCRVVNNGTGEVTSNGSHASTNGGGGGDDSLSVGVERDGGVGGTFVCHCHPGYTGKICEGNIDECTVLKPCKNNATCYDGINSYRCECLTPWTGPQCDVRVNACIADPCLNGGLCEIKDVEVDDDVDGGDAQYRCRCIPGYTGLNCEDRVKDCESQPCRNNATCVQENGRDAFSCQCLPGFIGQFCETNVDDCGPKPCHGSASCQDLIDDFRCDCPAGFTGRTCNTTVKPCAPSPCLFGGLCQEGDQGIFTCTCPAGVEGDRCHTVISASFDGQSSLDFTSLTGLMDSLPARGQTEKDDEISVIRRRRSSCSGRDCAEIPGQRIIIYNGDSDYHLLNDARVIWKQESVLSGPNKLSKGERDIHTSPESLVTDGRSIVARNKRDTHHVTGHHQAVLISFTFTTTVLDGILFLATGTSKENHPQHIVMELRAPNLLYLSMNNGHQTVTSFLILESHTLNVHTHAVELSLGEASSNTTATLKVTSSSCTGTGSTSTGNGNGNGIDCPSSTLVFRNVTEWNFDGPLHVGGVGVFTPYTRGIVTTMTGFTGCLGNFAINGQTVNLGEANQFSGSEPSSSAPEVGCQTHSPCLPDLCQNGGKCIDLWVDKRCDCPIGFQGAKCEIQHVAHFEGDSMLYLGSFDQVSEISFWVTGTQPNGLLLYTLAGDSVSLSLENSFVRMSTIFQGTSSHVTVLVGNSLPLGKWLNVHLALVDDSYTLEVSTEDDGVLDSVDGRFDRSVRVYGPMFMGTLHPHPALDKWRKGDAGLSSVESLKGCVKDVSINGQPVNILDTSPSPLGNDPSRPRPGCPREESCGSLPCSNGGVCLADWDGATCLCDEHFHGTFCENATSYTFDGIYSYSFLQIDRTVIGFGERGGLEFRSRQNISTLMKIQVFTKTGQSDFMEFRIFQGRLQTFSTFSQETVETPISVSDGAWHRLTWTRTKDVWFISLDEATFDFRAGLNPYHSDLSHTIHVYVGARPLSHDTSSHIVGFFQGCIRNVTFNSHLINLAAREDDGTSQPGIISTPNSIVSGCHNISICNINPCPANSFCQDVWNDFSCLCLPGWEGPNCQQSVDDCLLSVCQNNAVCVDHHLSYTCECPPQFTGRLCETSYEPCQESVCLEENTVSCTSYNYSFYVCECVPGYDGKTCDTLINNCLPNPCLNEAVCVNAVNNYTCKCKDGFLGRNCHIRDYCISTPCYNGGACSLIDIDDNNNNEIDNNSDDNGVISNSQTTNPASSSSSSSSSTSSSSNRLPFVCQCVAPYYGSQCQEYDYCQQNLCKNNATCLLETDRYTCQCRPGFYGTFCQFKDHCFIKPCLHGGECRNSADSYTCVCPFYFTGDRCQTPVNQCLNNVCLNGATCVFNESSILSSSQSSSSSSSIGDPVTRTYECICLEGFKGENCEIDIDECESGPCQNNATCVESSSLTRSSFFPGYRCDCVLGFTGQRCEGNINDCLDNPCQNGGVCEDRVNGYDCACPAGFFNPDCTVDKRGCVSAPCLNGAACQDEGDGDFLCSCVQGFEGALCATNKDDCVLHECVNGGVCVDGLNNYMCQCLDGYGGPRCTEIVDACYTQPCHHGGVCSYRGVCSCVDVVIACGWHDENCQTDRCLERDDCRLVSPAYSCQCEGTGYTGTQCTVDEDECSTPPSSPCHNGGVCTNTVGGYTCNCDDTGYEGLLCQDDVDECASRPEDNPCYNGGTCINEIGTFGCQCLDAWTGDLCGQRKNFCEGDPCLNQGVCTTNLAGFTCDCTLTGFEGDTCDLNINDCVNNRCEHGSVCVDGIRQYTCVCDGTGYTGQFCQEPSSSCASLSCLHNGTCVLVGGATVSGVTCLCHDTGYHGHRCQYDDDECQEGSHLCRSESASCVNTQGSYTCDCRQGYTGQYCETAMFREDEASSADVSDGVIAVCVLLVLFLVLMLALYLLWQWKRKRKTQGRYKPSQVENVLATGEIPMDKLANRDERLI